MALKIFANITANGEAINGDATQEGRENMTEVTEFNAGVSLAYDKDSGRVTGRRAHQPFSFTFPVTQGGPGLFQACVQNQTVDVSAQFWRPNMESGLEEHFYTLELTNGRIVHLSKSLPDTFDPTTANVPPMMTIEVVAQHVVWRHEIASTEAEDNWEAARA